MSALIGLLERGGILMVPLLLFSVISLWIFLERFYHLKRADGKAEYLFKTVRDLVLRRDWEGAVRRTRECPGPVAAVFRELLEQRLKGKPDLEELAAIEGRKELKRLTVRLPLLNLIAGLAPLIGLLGTVMGMVKAFQKVATAQGAVNPSLLASGIWEALLTTVAGLMVAIPAFIFHHYLDEKVKEYAFQMNHYGTLLIRLLTTTEGADA
ncbi:MAG: MotA/TolQ/ExbB proton channel family protein [Candidatus Methylomirabilales bacterium]